MKRIKKETILAEDPAYLSLLIVFYQNVNHQYEKRKTDYSSR
ncbi:hypothetical protein [Bacillus sp. UMB0893]|nr:hypothetical protein [Bacillus sp. UMB0893]